MRGALSRDLWPGPAGRTRRAGVTLVEVLAAIFIMGVGLLALLDLFPLGALELAQAVKDDRAAAVYANALALSEAGEDLLSRTADFVAASLSSGSADPEAAAQLREEYEELADQAAGLGAQLEDLRSLLPHPKVQRHLSRLLAQIRLIERRIDLLAQFLSLLEDGGQ